MADSKRKAMKGTANSEWMSGFLTADELANGYTGVEIRAGEGNDGLGGTALGDELHGEGGNDQLHGHGGNDTLYGGEGDDTSYGGDGDDVLEDLQGRNGFYGGNGNDIIRAGEANDTIAGEGGDDRVWAGGGHNTVWLGEGHDFVEAGAGNDTITGDGGNDEIRAGGGDNTVYAGSGNDTVVAGDGRDRITGDDGHDSIEAGGGNDTIYAGSGNDTIDGGSGNDFITGDAGYDVIGAGSGSDTVYAGDGDDRVIQDAGENIGATDLLDGGSGFDTLVLSTTEDQYLDAAFQQELSHYKTMIANGSSAWQQYKFASLSLTVNGFEKLELVNHGPSEFGDKAVLQSGTEDNDYRITTEDLVTGYRDVDGDALKVIGLTATNGTITDNHDGTYTFTPAANYNGSVTLSYSVTDGKGAIVAASQSFEVRVVNDAPAGHVSITGITAVGEVLTADAAGISDADGLGELHYTWQRMDDDGSWVDIQGANQSSYTLTEDDGATVVRSVVSYMDQQGTAETVVSQASSRVVTPSIAPVGAKVITFENLQLPDGQEAPVANGYEGLNWTQAGVYNPDGSTGYTAVGNMLSFVGEMDGNDRPGYEGEPRSPLTITREGGGDFSVFGANFSSPRTDNQHITVRAWDDGVVVGAITIKADMGFADHFNFEGEGQRFTSVDKVDFISSTYFGLDNLAMQFTNEVPVVVDDEGSVNEDSSVTIDVLANDYDPDVQTLSLASVGASSLGVQASILNGMVHYDASTLDYLKAGEVVEDTLTYTVTDGTTPTDGMVKVTVTGVNDQASISGTKLSSVTEDNPANASGKLMVSDMDSGENVFKTPSADDLSGNYGAFTFDAQGNWTYTLNNSLAAVQNLNAGQKLTDAMVVKSLDGTASETISVDINGANEPVSGFMGKRVDYTYHFPNRGSVYENREFIVGDGVETVIAEGSYGTIDITDDRIKIDFNMSTTWNSAAFNGFIIRDEYGVVPRIADVNILSNNMAGFDDSDLVVTDNSVGINWQGLSFTSNTYIELGVIFA